MKNEGHLSKIKEKALKTDLGTSLVVQGKTEGRRRREQQRMRYRDFPYTTYPPPTYI